MSEIRQDARPATPKWRLPRPALLTLALAAAAAIAAPLALGGGAAYAISKNDDGTIFVTINEAREPKSLQADLRAMGLNAVVDYIPRGKRCSPQPRSRSFLAREEVPLLVWPGPEAQESGFTIDPRAVGDGQVAVLEFSVSGQPHLTVAGIWARVSDGPVADCELVDSTEAPLGPSTGG
ncbi:hypothetical protein AB0F88_27020 [Streptosporangium sp. NPDC023963]|uniref:hypothetical protein n=1 Tax=Streptosporangium sp. NPDC023963 TaxID=3155608 RepID=UPI003439840C